MRVCTAKQMGAIDREAIDGGVPALELMERAGRAVTGHVLEFLAEHIGGHGHDHGHGDHDHGDHVHGGTTDACGPGGCGDPDCADAATDEAVLVVCGRGNNGGDGLVVARLLAEEGVPVVVLLLAEPRDLARDARRNLERLPEGVDVVTAPAADWPAAFAELAGGAAIAVDAVLGTGARLPLDKDLAALFRAMNDAAVPTLAVDVPSGVCGDDGAVAPVAVAADVTVAIGLPKLGVLLAPGRDYAGRVEVVDIGFANDSCDRHAGPWHWAAREDYLALLPPRPTSVHKGQCGHLLLVAGSRAYGGAAHLAGLGALRSGVGMLTLAAPAGLEVPLRLALPEALLCALPETATGTIAPVSPAVAATLLARAGAVAIGPGLGDDARTTDWVRWLVREASLPLVIDADGLNALAGADLSFSGRQVVLTPHPGEFARLAGLPVADVVARRLELAGWAADRWGAVVVLKGSPAIIGVPGEGAWLNASGDDALARGGSGDVLAGLVGGLLAQGCSAREAALLGCYVHGLAGTAAAREMSSRGVLVREVAAAIGPQWLALEREASGIAALRERLWPSVAPEAPR